jgi:hypothetical protein
MKASSTKAVRTFIIIVAFIFLITTFLLIPIWNHNEFAMVVFWLAAGAQFARNATKKGWTSALITLGLNISVFFSIWSHNPFLIGLVAVVLVIHAALLFFGLLKKA